MILIQRVRVRWTAAARGSPAANARRGLVRAMPPPRPLPDAELVVHDVLADQEAGYEHREGVRAGGVELAREVGLWLGHYRASGVVDRLPGSPRGAPLAVEPDDEPYVVVAVPLGKLAHAVEQRA
ncbi:hypothetical protein [Micromonospora sp. WMMC273]|uniref:hypothetical protein n=1 Tax=Micromonospora sp. WMMC273 TaxID=3015157 RepID=UPI0022B72CBF|nr:hypothetical protein [Micromonospora sp. WMMC273]MCZ7475033.1 hypothetical protein [Micromonospora sp. WMMC273]